MEDWQHSSHLFTLRMWQEELGDGEAEWRGRVEHVISGEVCYFRQWMTLIYFLLAVLADKESDSHDAN